MKSKLDHIGIAVRNLEEAAAAYAQIGLELTHSLVAEANGVKLGFLPIGGAGAAPGVPQIELLEPLGPETNVGKFIARYGEGVHHICLEVEDIEAAIAELTGKGVELIDRVPRRGAEGLIAFLHPRAAKGVLVELIQKDKE